MLITRLRTAALLAVITAAICGGSRQPSAARVQPATPVQTPQAPAAQSAAEPNIIFIAFIAADDIPTPVSAYGDPNVKTPNIDQLAPDGVINTRVYHKRRAGRLGDLLRRIMYFLRWVHPLTRRGDIRVIAESRRAVTSFVPPISRTSTRHRACASSEGCRATTGT